MSTVSSEGRSEPVKCDLPFFESASASVSCVFERAVRYPVVHVCLCA